MLYNEFFIFNLFGKTFKEKEREGNMYFISTLRAVVILVPFALVAIISGFTFQIKASADIEQKREEIVATTEQRPDPQIELSAAAALSPESNAQKMIEEGRQILRFDTFGDEAFWGDTLKLHTAIETVSPKAAVELGLKIDVSALPKNVIREIREGIFDFENPKNTVLMLKRNAVVGVTGFFDKAGNLISLGIQCALCHSTVDNFLTFGIGHRLDGWANRDLNVGAIVATSPNLAPVATLLGTDVATVKTVLNSWGPGKFDAELFFDGKAFRPDGGPAATLIPNAFDLAGFNQVTWTGAWGTVTYWNALVANLEMHGKGTFFDPRLDDTAKFPIAAREGFGHVRTDPDNDQITSKLSALHFYQLALSSPKPKPGMHFNKKAAERGDKLFAGKATCNNCHVEPLWTEPGWNLHKPSDIGIDDFQSSRAPDNTYKTSNLSGLFIRELGIFMKKENKGRFYHDGRFATLKDVVEHYNSFFLLNLTPLEISDLVEYLKSL